jgi:hypothetical protein
MGLINSFLSFHGSQELPKHREERKATTLWFFFILLALKQLKEEEW